MCNRDRVVDSCDVQGLSRKGVGTNMYHFKWDSSVWQQLLVVGTKHWG